MWSHSAPRLEKSLTIYGPTSLVLAATAAANKRMVSVSSYAREALLSRLKADGIEIAENERVAV